MKDRLKLAYLVIAYMDPEELRRMVQRLSPVADVYIHINASVDIEPFQKALQGVEGRVCFSRERFKVVWGGFSILKATFTMLEQALEYADYDRIVLLTGLDYPVKSDEQLEEFFCRYSDTEFTHADVTTGDAIDHLNYYACRDNRVLQKLLTYMTVFCKKLGLRARKDTIVIDGKRCPLYGKAPKWALTGECAKYVLSFYKTHPGVNRYFQLMHAPDDFYIPTVVMNSKFKSCVETDNIFKVVWLPDDKGAKILDESDYAELVECPQLYAKKFQSGYSEELQKMLDKR